MKNSLIYQFFSTFNYVILFTLIGWSPLFSQKSIYEKTRDSLKDQATYYNVRSDFDSAYQVFSRILDYGHAHNDNCLICDYYLLNSTLEHRLQNYEMLKKIVSEGKNYCLKCSSKDLQAMWYVRLGRYQDSQLDYNQSIQSFKTAVNIFFEVKDSMRAYETQTFIGEIYDKQNRCNESTTYFIDFYKHSQKRKNKRFKTIAQTALANHFLVLKQPTKSLELSKTIKALAIETNNKMYYNRCLEIEAKANFLLKNYAAAHSYWRQFMNYYGDTLMVEQQLASIELMKAQQEDYLIKNTLKIQDKKLKNQKYIFNGNLIFLFVLLIFSLGLYKIYNKLKTNNRDKEFLFNEMHFRVNENLHLISEMMKLQSQSLTDKNTLNVMREVQNRIDVMYLIQQQLSLQNKESVIEMTNYITILAMTIIDSFGKKNLIKFSNSNVKLYLKVDLAVKIGLIVNELITNSLKHGFPDQSKGEIEIICEMQKSKKLYIKVKDNGIGSAGKFPQNIISSFGSSLIEMLSQKLNGLMEVTSDEGYCTEFYFDLQ